MNAARQAWSDLAEAFDSFKANESAYRMQLERDAAGFVFRNEPEGGDFMKAALAATCQRGDAVVFLEKLTGRLFKGWRPDVLVGFRNMGATAQEVRVLVQNGLWDNLEYKAQGPPVTIVVAVEPGATAAVLGDNCLPTFCLHNTEIDVVCDRPDDMLAVCGLLPAPGRETVAAGGWILGNLVVRDGRLVRVAGLPRWRVT